jgi:hypothetical protein
LLILDLRGVASGALLVRTCTVISTLWAHKIETTVCVGLYGITWYRVCEVVGDEVAWFNGDTVVGSNKVSPRGNFRANGVEGVMDMGA